MPSPLYFAGLDLGQRNDYSALAVVEEPLWVPDYLDTWVRDERAPGSSGYVSVSGCYVSPTRLLEPIAEFFRRKAAAAKRRSDGAVRAPSPPGVRRPAEGAMLRPLPSLALRYLHRWALGTPYPQIVADVGNLFAHEPLKGMTALVVDYTGVGRPIGDLFTKATIGHIALTITGGQQVIASGKEVHVPKRDLAMGIQSLLQSDRLRFAAGLPLLDILKSELQAFEVKVTNVGNDTYEAWRRDNAHDDVVLAVAMACWYREWTSDRTSAFSFSYLGKSDALPAYPLD